MTTAPERPALAVRFSARAKPTGAPPQPRYSSLTMIKHRYVRRTVSGWMQRRVARAVGRRSGGGLLHGTDPRKWARVGG